MSDVSRAPPSRSHGSGLGGARNVGAAFAVRSPATPSANPVPAVPLPYLMAVWIAAGAIGWAAFKTRPPGAFFVLSTVLGGIVVACGFWAPLPMLGMIGGVLAVAVLRRCGVPGRWAGPGTLAALAALIAADATNYYRTVHRPFMRRVAAAQEKYPPVPRSAVLPQPPPAALAQPAPHPATPEWAEAFADTDTAAYTRDDWDARQRNIALKHLYATHLTFAERFARRPDFGALRMVPNRDMPALLADGEWDVAIPVLPQPRAGRMWPDGDVTAEPAADAGALEALALWHARRGIGFANAPGFGLLAQPGGDGWDEPALPPDADPADAPFLLGFSPHAARTSPGAGPLAPRWELVRVELIGLVLHDEPVAYASDELPRMGETATHATRPLTAFERSALPRLAAGEWVVAAAHDYRLRAVGALPAAKACAECHGVEEGRLLGALSYDFERNLRVDGGDRLPSADAEG